MLLSGGETTVTVRGNGPRRPQRRVPAGARGRAGRPARASTPLAGDTDGIDGAEEIAGAIVTPDTLARAAAHGINAEASLADNDGHGFFEALGDQVVTGPTLTNVNDFRAILIACRLAREAAVQAETYHAPSPQRQDRRHRSAPPAPARRCIRALFEAGADVFRLTSATARTRTTKRATTRSARIEKEVGRPIGMLADLQGPKLRRRHLRRRAA